MEPKLYDTIIVGGGPEAIPPLSIRPVLACPLGDRKALSRRADGHHRPGGQLPGFPEGVNGFELAMKMQESAQRFGAETHYGEAVELELTASPKRIVTDSGEEFLAKTVILSTGASPRELGLPEERDLRGKGVSYCATCDGMFYKDKTVVIVGGGNTAAADALYLSKICKKVYLVHRRDTLRASRVYLEPLKSRENIEFVWNSEITALLHEEKLTGVTVYHKKTKSEQTIDCDGLFVAVGNVPNSQLFASQVNLTENGYVDADETTRTNLPGVFAIGDVRGKPLRQIITAAADGAVASQFAEEYVSLNK